MAGRKRSETTEERPDGSEPAAAEQLADGNGDAPAAKKVAKSKRQRFLELAPKRMANVRKALKNIGRCGNPAGYEYSRAEADRITEDLMEWVKAACDCYAEKPLVGSEGWSF